MPFILAREFASSERVFLVLAYGELSYLEACSTFSQEITRSETTCDEIADLRTKGPIIGKVQKLAGIHKVGIPLGEVLDDDFAAVAKGMRGILKYFSDKQNFCVSLYCSEANKQQYDFLVSNILQIIRENGFRKAKCSLGSIYKK